MFQWDAVDTSPDLVGQNVLKTFETAIRHNRRTTRTSFLSLHLFSLTFRNIFLALLRGGGDRPIAPCGCATGTMSNVDARSCPEHDRRLQVTKLPHDSTALVKTFTRRKQTDLQFSKMPINFERKNCH